MMLINTSSQVTATPNPNESNHEAHKDGDDNDRINWPSDLLINSSLILVFLWFLYCFVKHHLEMLSLRSTNSQHSSMSACAMASCMFVLLHQFSTEALIIVGRLEISDEVGETVCDVLYRINASSYYFCSLPILVFFWIQHRFLYSEKKFQIKHTSSMMALGWIALAVHISSIVVAEILENFYTYSHLANQGCVEKSDTIYENFPYFIFEGAEIISQTFIFITVYNSLEINKQVPCTTNKATTCWLGHIALQKQIFDINRRAVWSLSTRITMNIIGIVLVATLSDFDNLFNVKELILDTLMLCNTLSISFACNSFHILYEPLISLLKKCVCTGDNRTDVISPSQI